MLDHTCWIKQYTFVDIPSLKFLTSVLYRHNQWSVYNYITLCLFPPIIKMFIFFWGSRKTLQFLLVNKEILNPV